MARELVISKKTVIASISVAILTVPAVQGLIVAAGLTVLSTPMVQAQYQYYFPDGDGGDYIPTPPPPPPPPPPVIPTPPPPPPPVVIPTPPPAPPPTIPQIQLPPPQLHVFIPPITTPTDVTNPAPQANGAVPLPRFVGPAQSGVALIPAILFPKKGDQKGNSDWILVRGDDKSVFEKPTPYAVKLEHGQIIVSVRRPSQMAMIETPLGDVALSADGDVLMSYNDEVLRIFNLSSRGKNCKVKLGHEVFEDSNQKAMTVAAGYELVCSHHKVTRAELRPADGVARRGMSLLANGHIGISEFSVSTVLANSTLISSIVQQADNAKERRILADMSKMAAVLNHVQGTQGYSYEGAQGLAMKPKANPPQ